MAVIDAATATPCDACGSFAAVVVVTEIRQHGKRPREFKACPSCHLEYVQQTAANRKDEERERQEAAERSRKAAERDRERSEKQRSTGNDRRAS